MEHQKTHWNRLEVTKEQRTRAQKDENPESIQLRDQVLLEKHQNLHGAEMVHERPGHAQQPQSSASSLNELIQITKADMIPLHKHHLFTLKPSNTIHDLLQLFKQHHIHSAPVVDDSSKFLGVVDLMDVLSLLCSMFPDKPASPEDEIPYQNAIKPSDQKWSLFINKRVGDLIEASRPESTPSVAVDTPFKNIISLLADGNQRVVVVNQNNETVNIITQFNVMMMLNENLSLLHNTSLQNATVQDIVQWGNPINTIPGDTLTIGGFWVLRKGNLPAAAVPLEETGLLTETLSVYDLLGLLDDKFDHINAPITKFLLQIKKSVTPQKVCYPSDSFSDIVQMFIATGVHNLWVVEPTNKNYLACLTITDIIKYLNQFISQL